MNLRDNPELEPRPTSPQVASANDSVNQASQASAARPDDGQAKVPEQLSATRTFGESPQALIGGSSVRQAILPAASFEQEKTVISQRPATAPQKSYRSLALSDLAEMLEGCHLDHFAVQQIVGGGGMGAVFRGVDQRLDRTVAIKVIPGSKRDEDTLRRFHQEAQAAARLDHPNIARVYYVGEAEQWNYIVFEFIDGVNIRDMVDMDGPLSVDDAVFFTRQIAEALQHAHERDVVHRDIKPSNILVTDSGMAKLVDMGLARDTSEDKSTRDQTASGVTLGTFDYISPEQARDPRDADVRSDLYSLGCTLFFMLTGHPPFPEGTALQKLLNHGSLPPPDPRGWREDISDELHDILMKLMAKRPADRYQRPVELINDLMILAEQEHLLRSQRPATIMLNFSSSQPSLIETHLPWLIAAMVLFSSAVWLHSQMSLTTGFAFPDAPYSVIPGGSLAPPAIPTVSPTANFTTGTRQESLETSPAVEGSLLQPTKVASTLPPIPDALPPVIPVGPANPPDNDAIRIGSELPWATSNHFSSADRQTPVAIIVVATTQPSDVAYSWWEVSLHRAVQRAIASDDRTEIEIRGNVTLNRPLQIQGSKEVIIRGADAQSIIEVSPSLWNGAAEQAAITVNGNLLTLADIRLQYTHVDNLGTPKALIKLGEQGSLNCLRSVFTVGGNRFDSICLVSTAGMSSDHYNNSRLAAPKINFQDCFMHGAANAFQVDYLRANSRAPVGIKITNCLIAIRGWVLDLQDRSVNGSMASSIEMLCDRSTVLSEAGFAQLYYTNNGQRATRLDRISQSCIYWSGMGNPHIQIHNQAAGTLELTDYLRLRGTGNIYDQNIQQLVAQQTVGIAAPIKFLIAEAPQQLWYSELESDRSVRWQTSPQLITDFAVTSPVDFRPIVQPRTARSPFVGSDSPQ